MRNRINRIHLGTMRIMPIHDYGEGLIAMPKCPSCDGTRNSTGETYGPRKVWVSDGVPFHPPQVMLSVPPATEPYVSPSIHLRCVCLNPPCIFGIVFRYWLIGNEMMVIGKRDCPTCKGRGFIVMRLSQSALMPLRRETIAWVEMAKET